MKKLTILLCLVILLLAGCNYDMDKIALFSREEGSGTREMFVTGLGIMQEGRDDISDEANVTNSGAVMLSAVAQNKNAIGFISAATANDKVRAVTIDGYEVTDSKNYPLFRNFIVAFNTEKLNPAVNDFLTFLRSDKAMQIASEMGYFEIEAPISYQMQSGAKGKIVIAGSASVFPLMNRLREEYGGIQKEVEIEIQQNDSSTGIALLGQGLADIAMSSRSIKSGELGNEFKSMSIVGDAIAVVVHPENARAELSSLEIRNIFNGKIKKWSELQ